MYAIIEDSGTQLKVEEGDEVTVDTRELPLEAATLTFDRVLLLADPAQAGPRIGKPYLEGARVTGDILEEGRGEKVYSVKFRKRKGYRRVRGHRQPYIKVRITGIEPPS